MNKDIYLFIYLSIHPCIQDNFLYSKKKKKKRNKVKIKYFFFPEIFFEEFNQSMKYFLNSIQLTNSFTS